MDRVRKYLLSLSRGKKQIILILHDAIVFLLAFTFSLFIGNERLSQYFYNYFWLLCIVIPVSVLVIFYLGSYQIVLRFAGSKVYRQALFSSCLSAVLLTIFSFFGHVMLPRRIPIMYALIGFLLLSGSRIFFRFWFQYAARKHAGQYNVLIYGAGDSGRQLAEALKQLGSYWPVAFIDDNPKLHGTIIHDLKVCSPKDIEHLCSRYEIKKILLAIPSATPEQRSRILLALQSYSCEVLTIPGMKDLIDGKISVSTLKKITVNELLGRTPVNPDESLLRANIQGKIVMVSGAGGSIGSELCRQIIRLQPSALVLFELTEFALYQIDKELREYCLVNGVPSKVYPLLGSVQNESRLRQVISAFSVQTIYHAAAYKHVPMVEYNIIEGIRNNVFGTINCARIAAEFGVETFVLISTDKAVRPTNTMGASKRLSELALQALAKQTDISTRFCMVRFGNVLGSSGSVVPVFERQIENGGPVTVTHPEITRFFMTIPEAAQLVIQAGAMGKGGDVFVLDMGQPIKIIDLARQMIRLSGLRVKDQEHPDGDIEIIVTGLRPGEKLYEELLIGEDIVGTKHPRIMTSNEVSISLEDFNNILRQLDTACIKRDFPLIRQIILTAPTGFHPTDDICDITYLQQKNRHE